MPFILDLVNLANNVRLSDTDGKSEKKSEPIGDEDGSRTVEYLSNVERRVLRITGTEPVSIGVHPAVYFYTLGGQFQPTAFLATSDFLEELNRESKLNGFTQVRAEFEEFLVAHKTFISQIVHKQGSGGRSRAPIKAFYRYVFDSLISGEDGAKTLESLIQMPAFDFLKPGQVEEAAPGKKEFSRGVKTAAYLREALEAAIRCAICKARLHRNSIQTDHIERRRDGGTATLGNAQLSHPYCNSTFKQ